MRVRVFTAAVAGIMAVGAAVAPTGAQAQPAVPAGQAAAAAGQAAAPVVQPPADRAAAVAEFDAARKEMKRLVSEMQLLGAEYQNETDKAKQDALEAKFNALKPEAEQASDRLETAAFAVVLADPNNKGARDICGAVVVAAFQNDDPQRTLQLADLLDKAGVLAQPGDVEKEVTLVAATAAMVLSKLDLAQAWLGKAAAAGVEQGRVGQLETAIAREAPKVEAEMAARAADEKADDRPRVKITTTRGEIVVELFENEAPNTVANFISLVEKGLYAGTPFHRVIGGFMAQGGDPSGTGRGGPGYAIPCECELPDARKHFLGTLSMAHAGKDTGGSQFFLTFRPTEHLDGRHTVFGRVIEGFDVLPKLIRTQDPQGRNVPGIKPDRIVKAEVVRKRDHEYKPQTLPDPKKGG
jgi:cyclophilin family peptidyl-prolyl cis-trans isomerase